MISIVVATTKSWNIENAKAFMKANKGKFRITLVTKPDQLTYKRLIKLNPTFIFFPHWSWIIPQEIHDTFTCVVFHMTDLPFGRGGSPLQNLLSRGVYTTKVSALKVDGGLDTGPIYLKKKISIKDGTAEDILRKISTIVFRDMIPMLLKRDITPKVQKGKVVSFKRRKKAESTLINDNFTTLRQLYDHIRMLDGEGYPPAFIDLPNQFRLTLTNAKIKGKELTGCFVITKGES